MECENCGVKEAKTRKAMTAYHYEGERNSPEDPNRDIILCDECWEEYAEYWTERWEDANYDRY